MEGLQDYLSCEVTFSMDEKEAWLGQPHLIKNLAEKFGNHVKNIPSHKTPDTSKFLKIRPMVERSEKIFPDDQQEYQLGVGMQSYLVKHS